MILITVPVSGLHCFKNILINDQCGFKLLSLGLFLLRFLWLNCKMVEQYSFILLKECFQCSFQHNFKKLRNNLWKSAASQNAKRILCKGTAPSRFILWKHLQEAFEWDQSKISLKRYQKLTPAHFELNPASLMRNHLANDVLNNEMLNLMRVSYFSFKYICGLNS